MSEQTPSRPHQHHRGDVVATFGASSSRDVVACRICGRTLLMGERSTGFFTEAGEGPYDVCELCVPRAGRYGLRSQPVSPDDLPGTRRRGSIRRLAAGVGRGARAAVPTRRPRKRRRAAAADGTAADGRLGNAPVGAAAVPVALARFNQSSHARTLAGLSRTLGAPRACVLPRSGTDREVILTVAWEIVWYRFRIMPDGIEDSRGTHLQELPARWQQWNCTVAPDGTVRFAADDDDHDDDDDPAGADATAAAPQGRQTRTSR